MGENKEDENYYEILGVEMDASEKQLTKAYRKMALQYHPDKNPDNPSAVAMFHRLSMSYDALMDGAKRAALDAALRSKVEKRRRDDQLDSARRKFKTDLEERENAARQQKYSSGSYNAAYSGRTDSDAVLKRLREENLRYQMEHEKELMFNFASAAKSASKSTSSFSGLNHNPKHEDIFEVIGRKDEVSAMDKTVKVRWSKKLSFEEHQLSEIFSHYGKISHLIMSQSKPFALIEFDSILSAHSVMKQSDSLRDRFESIQWASGGTPQILDSILSDLNGKKSSAEEPTSKGDIQGSLSYETATLLKMRQAAESMDRDAKRREALKKAEKEALDG